MMSAQPDKQQRLREADQYLRMRDAGRCADICATVLSDEPDNATARLMLARALQMQGRFDDMLAQLDEAKQRSSLGPLVELMRVEALMAIGEIEKARTIVVELCEVAKTQHDPQLLGRAAELHTQLTDHDGARRAFEAAAELKPDDLGVSYNLASAEIACGQLETAEARLDALIARAPGDFDAAYNRATIRTQTPDRNHIEELKRGLAAGGSQRGEFALCYALAKELEDVGEYDESFAYLKRGAASRKALLQYNVESDVQTLASLAENFDGAYFRQNKPGCDDHVPIFVVGLPRSGTTLVDRILSSHPEVGSVGEVNDFALALTRHAGGSSGKGSLIKKSVDADVGAIGRQYAQSIKQRHPGATYVVDKTPLNFLYLGLIAKSLPNAKIVHIVRDDMDVGFAMYKTLFRMGYPFSYDLTDIGKYIRAKSALMDHWNAVMGERIQTVSYERLIANPDQQTRNLIQNLGLKWSDQCLEFYENRSPTATASAAQVRRPIYSTSVNKWRNYQKHLGALSKALCL